MNNVTEELYYKSKWMVKYGLPWVVRFGNVNTLSLKKHLDCNDEILGKIRHSIKENKIKGKNYVC